MKVALPLALVVSVAVTVTVELPRLVGVPLIRPVEELIVRPWGKPVAVKVRVCPGAESVAWICRLTGVPIAPVWLPGSVTVTVFFGLGVGVGVGIGLGGGVGVGAGVGVGVTGTVPDRRQVDDHGDVLIAAAGVAPAALVDADHAHAVEPVWVLDQHTPALGQHRVVRGVPRHAEVLGDPSDGQVLTHDAF